MTQYPQALPVLGERAQSSTPAAGVPVRVNLDAIQPLIDALPFYVLLVDRHHNIAAANRALGEALAIEPREIRGKFCPRLIHGREDTFPGCPLPAAVREQVPATCELLNDQGGCFESSMFPSTLVGDDGEPLYLHFVSNVTERREAAIALARSAEHQAAIIRLLERIPACQSGEELLREVIAQVVGISWMGLNTRAAAFIVRGETLHMVHQYRLAEPLLERCARVALGTCLCGRVAATHEPYACSGLTADHEIRHPGMLDHGHVVLPLNSGEQTLGVLNFYLEAGQSLDAHRMQFLELVASLTAEALGRVNLRSRLILIDRMATVGTLAAGVAHEIRNPLTYVLYNLESLAEELTDLASSLPLGAENPGELDDAGAVGRRLDWADLASRAQDALDGAVRIRNIVNDLNVFAHRAESRSATVSVPDVIESALRLALNEVKHRASIEKNFRSVPCVQGNPARLGQVFLNLIINAAHSFTDGRPYKRNVLTLATWQEGDDVCVEVRDTGRGIAAEDLPHIFEPFFTTKPSGVGTGLGLSICQEIVSKMNGSIRVESELGAGTRFVVRIPRARTVDETDAARARQSSLPVARQAGARVLIIDDEPIVRSTLARMLGGEHQTFAASSGEAAKKIIESDSNFDVLVSDVMMQDGDGMDLHAWLNSCHPRLARRTVFVTGGASTPMVKRFLEQVPNPKLEKPLRARELLAAVQSVLGHGSPTPEQGQAEQLRR